MTDIITPIWRYVFSWFIHDFTYMANPNRNLIMAIFDLKIFLDPFLVLYGIIWPDQKEGVVIRREAPFHNDEFEISVAKYVREHHVQTDEH